MSRRQAQPVYGEDRTKAVRIYVRECLDIPALKSPPEALEEQVRFFNDTCCKPPLSAAEVHDLVLAVSQNQTQTSQPTYVEETPAKKALNEENYEMPLECLEGDRLCDLTHELTDGTFIPPQFVHGDLQVWTGHVLDGRIAPANSTYLDFSTRFYLNKFSHHPQTGKGESWKRVKWAFADSMQPRPLESLVSSDHAYMPFIVDGSEWGSGPFMISRLANTPNVICCLDEGSILWLTKAPTDQKALETAFLTLFEGNSHSTGSFKNKNFVATNVHLSLSACFTLDSFTESYQGRGSGGSGYLSRVALAFGTRIPTAGQAWPDYHATKAKSIATEIAGRLAQPKLLSVNPEAAKLITDFKKWLEKEDQHFVSRIAFYFDKDLTLRAAFRDSVVTADLVRRSIRWAQEQLNLRKRFWPVDSVTTQGVVEFKILSEFEASETLRSDRQLQDALRIGRRESKFSAQQYNFAREALLKSGQLERAGYNRKGNGIYKRRSV